MEAAHRFGVVEIHIGDISFYRDQNVMNVPRQKRRAQKMYEPPKGDRAYPESKIERESLSSEEYRIKEEQLDDLMLSDPAAAEKLLMSGEVSDDDDIGEL